MKENNSRAALRAQIDENLKRAYQEACSEEIPDRLKELIEKLRQKETER